MLYKTGGVNAGGMPAGILAQYIEVDGKNAEHDFSDYFTSQIYGVLFLNGAPNGAVGEAEVEGKKVKIKFHGNPKKEKIPLLIFGK